MLGQRSPEALEVACAKRDGPASRRAPGRVGEADELVSLCVSQELHDRREALLARTLRHGQLFHYFGLAPRGCGLGHATDANERNRAGVCRNVPNRLSPNLTRRLIEIAIAEEYARCLARSSASDEVVWRRKLRTLTR